jgi:protein-disulfide isomerase
MEKESKTTAKNQKIQCNTITLLSASIIIASLIISGSMFFVGASINQHLNGLTTIISQQNPLGLNQGQNNAVPENNGKQPEQNQKQPENQNQVNLEELTKSFAAAKGSEDAPVTIVEFSDYQCPFCRRWFNESLPEIQENYIDTGKVRFLYRDFPLSFHPMAVPFAEAARCAGDQEKYWEMHDKIFEEQDKFGSGTITSITLDDIKQWAEDLGLNTEEFNSCLDSGKYKQAIQDDFTAGSNLGVSGTPTFFINGQKIVGAQPYSTFEQLIESFLNQ